MLCMPTILCTESNVLNPFLVTHSVTYACFAESLTTRRQPTTINSQLRGVP